MKISVAICTWNRADLLDKTLANLLNLTHSDSYKYELIVVNNNCTDRTDEVINTYEGRLPLRRIFEQTPGLSNARNAAVRAATGDYIIWTDDDVLADKDWLVAYARAFIKWPEVAVFGGPIEPWFEGTPPDWLMKNWDHIADAFAVRDLGNEPIPLSVKGNIIPYGANFAIRMSEQARFLYDPKLGLNAGEIILSEETQVVESILREGFEGRWIPNAKVKHWLPKSRQSLKYIKKYYIGLGKTRHLTYPGAPSVKIFGYSRWLLRKTMTSYFEYHYKKAFSSPDVWLQNLARTYEMIGRLIGEKVMAEK